MCMLVRKVVFPVAGLGTRFHPITRAIPKEMLGILDKPLIHYAFEEAKQAGIDEFILITRRGKNAIEDYCDYIVAHAEEENMQISSVCYIRQNEPKGLGHAVLCAKDFVGNEPFAVMSADDFILGATSCIGDMISNYDGRNMVAAMTVPRKDVGKYGILDIDHEEGKKIIAKSVDEKPELEQAKSDCAIIGRYILSPEIFSVLENISPGRNDEIQLTDALKQMIPTHGLVGFKFDGMRFDCGSKEGILAATLEVASGTPELRSVMENFHWNNESEGI